ncbi:transmembrane protein, putative [Medicago truncatula]|uniref:Transmembrane protein, putative n=1 Tax=Medicago truncatula TaxID=3880 RepID=A0A072V5R2_MEDTR|nr:transmembrane protein, putative [Medicago truncatula]
MGPIVISTFGQTAYMLSVSLMVKLIVRRWTYNVVIHMMTKVFKSLSTCGLLRPQRIIMRCRVDRQNDKVIINSPTSIGVGVRTPVTASGLTISAIL